MTATRFLEWIRVQIEAIRKIAARDVQIFFVDLSLTGAGLGLIGLGIRAVWKENLGLAGTSLTAGLILLFSATIHRFELLKGLGIEAKTRELDRTINKAEVTLTQMKKLSEMVGTTVIKFNSSIGRAQRSSPLMEDYNLSRKVKELLKDIGTDPNTIHAALMPWARNAADDLFFYIISLIHKDFNLLEAPLRNRENSDLSVEDQGALLKRSYAMESYRMTSDDPRSLDIKLLAQSLRKYATGSPEKLSAECLEKIYEEIDIAEKEFNSLANNVDFLNVDYWRKAERVR